jgi:hypothetical protein
MSWSGLENAVITNQSLPRTSEVDASKFDSFLWEMEGLEQHSRFRRAELMIVDHEGGGGGGRKFLYSK